MFFYLFRNMVSYLLSCGAPVFLTARFGVVEFMAPPRNASHAQVLVKLLHHMITLLCGAGRGLDFFVPPWAKRRELYKGEGIMNMTLPAIDEMGLIRTVLWPRLQFWGTTDWPMLFLNPKPGIIMKRILGGLLFKL